MKILDRHILLSFTKNYLISFGVLIGLYIVLDMVVNFDELVVARGSAAAGGTGGFESALRTIVGIADYYFFQGFFIFNHLSGVIPVVAAAFTLIRMARNNEMTATLAAGVPLVRLALPIIVAAVVLNFVLLPINQEIVVPRIIPELMRERSKLTTESVRGFEVRLRDQEGRMLLASRFTPAHANQPATMEVVDILERDEQARPTALITAERATWNESAGEWVLHEGARVTGLRAGERRSPPEPVATYRSNLTPREVSLMRSGELVELLSTSEIDQLLARPQVYGTADLLRVKHSRFAQLLLNVILVLLAIGSILTREPGALRNRVLLCFTLVGACMAMIFLCQHLAGQPPLNPQWTDRWPAVVSWFPIFVFFPIALVLLDRVKS